MEPKTIRIFISSPGDVAEEREKSKLVIEQLQRWYGDAVVLLPVLWEDLPLGPSASFQEGVDMVLSDENGIDIAAFILWSRLGSPLGGITKADGSPYRSGTEREFDMMLMAAEATGGARPDMIFYRRFDDDTFNRRLAAQSDRSEFEAMVAQRDLVNEFIGEMFHDEHGHNTRAYHGFQQPVDFAGRLKVHLRQLIDRHLDESDVRLHARWMDAPYRGLEAFDLEHTDIFFGREEEVWKLEELLRQRETDPVDKCAFVAVIGASGSGKSSMVRAGLRANLTKYNLDESVSDWRSAVLMPGQAEGKILEALKDALKEEGALPEWQIKLRSNLAGTALEALNVASTNAGGTVKLLLVIDQFEELFTDKRISDEDRNEFLNTLGELAQSGRCWVIVTMRSDFYAIAQQSQIFLNLKGDSGQFDLLAPGPDALRRIIEEPARMAGVKFEQHSQEQGGLRLSAKILEEAQKQPDTLPLLQDLLLELYEHRTPDNELTFKVYDSLGGLEGALSQRAENLFTGLSQKQQDAFGGLLHALVTVDANTEAFATRRRAAKNKLADTKERKALIDALIGARLLTAGGDGEATVSLAHEALLRRWPRVSNWVSANREHLRIRSHVEQAMKRWKTNKEHTSLLLPEGLELEEGLSLANHAPHLIDGEEYAAARGFIKASHNHALARQKRATRVRRAVMTGLSALTITAVAGGILAWFQKNEAVDARGDADQLISFMLEDLQSKLESTGRLELAEGVIEKVDAYAEKEAPSNWEAFASRVRLEISRAKIYRTLGRADIASENLKETLEEMQNSKFEPPTPEEKEHLVAEIQLWLGDALSQLPDQKSESEGYLMDSVMTLEGLHKSNLESVEFQQLLALALRFLGDTQRDLNRPDEAIIAYEESIAIADEVGDNSELAQIKFDALDHRGTVAYIAGNLEEAEKAYSEAKKTIENQDPNDFRNVSRVARIYSALGSILQRTEPEKAPAMLQRSIEEFSTLVEREPRNALWRRQLGVTHHLLADSLTQNEKYGEALEEHKKGLKNIMEAAVQASEIATIQESLFLSFGDLGRFHQNGGNFDLASEYYTSAITKGDEIVADTADEAPDPNLLEKLAFLTHDLAETQRAAGNFAAAVSTFDKAVERWTLVEANVPDLAKFHASDSLINQAKAYIKLEQTSNALQSLSSAEQLLEQILGETPGEPGALSNLAISHYQRAQAHKVSNNNLSVLAEYEKSLTIFAQLIEANPEIDFTMAFQVLNRATDEAEPMIAGAPPELKNQITSFLKQGTALVAVMLKSEPDVPPLLQLRERLKTLTETL